MSSTSNELIGSIVGGVYRLDKVIATGATSVVYRGTHIRLDQPLAVKVLAGAVVSNTTLMARFEAEAKVQAKLSHPHIVSVYDFVREGDVHAIAMEYVDGVALDQLMYDLAAPMPLARIKELMSPVLQAVEYAHQEGIVHRDLKPSNILVKKINGHEYPKVMDFGIAKVLAEGVSQTAPGAMLGTLLFMSPEQCKALKTVDARSDIYSLGITLYQMATAMVPFYSESAFDIMLAHVQSPPTPPRKLVPQLCEQLEAIILKALAKDPEARFHSAAAMAHALQSVREDATGPVRLMPAETLPPSHSADLDHRADGRGQYQITTKRQADQALDMPELEGSGLTTPLRSEPRTIESGFSSLHSSMAGPASSAAVATRRIWVQERYPRKSKSIRRRRSSSTPEDDTRFLRLRLRLPSRDDWQRHYAINTLGGAIFCPVADPPQVGATVRVEILFVSGPRFFVDGIVTWRRPQTKDPRARAGAGVQPHPSERSKLDYINTWVEGTANDKRQHRRLPIKLRVAYSGRTGRRVNFTRDLDKNGVFVRSRELLSPDTPIQLVLMPPDGSNPITLNGRVSRLVEDVEERGMGISLAFDDELDRREYASFVDQLEQRFLAGELPEAMLF